VTGSALASFMIGFVSGAAVFWQLSKVSERFRRARRDFRAARKGMRTLAEMVVSRGWQAIKVWTLAAAIVGAAVAAWLGARAS